jgi:hypothetical protein
MLAVFERLDMGLLETLLGAASGETALPFVKFVNQPAGSGSVPDASISGSFKYVFEVKTVHGAPLLDQVGRHLSDLAAEGREEQRVFVLTPDVERPVDLGKIGDARVVWFNFLSVSQAIDGILSGPADEENETRFADPLLISEQQRFLLRELQTLFTREGLITPPGDVLVVAASSAYGDYLRYSSYICQPGRSFRPGIPRMAFYADGAIQREVPRIVNRRDNLALTDDQAVVLSDGSDLDRSYSSLIRRLQSDKSRRVNGTYQVFLLTSPGDPATTLLPKAIRNTSLDQSGRPVAWTQGQRYARLKQLARVASGPATTDQLVGDKGLQPSG